MAAQVYAAADPLVVLRFGRVEWFSANFLTLPLGGLTSVICKLVEKTSFQKAHELDLTTGIRQSFISSCD